MNGYKNFGIVFLDMSFVVNNKEQENEEHKFVQKYFQTESRGCVMICDTNLNSQKCILSANL